MAAIETEQRPAEDTPDGVVRIPTITKIINLFKKDSDTEDKWYTPYVEIYRSTDHLTSYIFDVGTDVATAYWYYGENHAKWAALTLTFALLPILMEFLIQLGFGEREGLDAFCGALTGPIKPLIIWAKSVIRNGRIIIAQLRGKEVVRERGYRHRKDTSKKEDELEIRTFKLIECIFETIPDMYLQLYIVCIEGKVGNWMQILNIVKSVALTARYPVSITRSICKLLDTESVFKRLDFFIFQTITTAIVGTVHCLAVVLFITASAFYTFALVVPQFVAFFLAWLWKTAMTFGGVEYGILPSLIGATSAIVGVHTFGLHLEEEAHFNETDCFVYFWLFQLSIVCSNGVMIAYWYIYRGCLLPLGWHQLIFVVVGTVVGVLLDLIVMWIYCPHYIYGQYWTERKLRPKVVRCLKLPQESVTLDDANEKTEQTSV